MLLHERNRGKGAALRTGFAAATASTSSSRTPTSSTTPAEYGVLLEPLEAGEADVVFGSRFLGGDRTASCTSGTRSATGSLTLLSNMFTNLNLTDMETCYKAFRREVLDSRS